MHSVGARRRVLVSDDDPLLRWALGRQLAERGLETIEADSVRETLEHEAEADLVLLDLRLPDGNGLATARALLARRPGRPLLLMTSFATPELVAEAARTGVRRCIDKSFDVDELARIVEESLRAQRRT
jgi:DNA-binding NtrC family response regulator